jgi:hypothetical protein
MLWLDHRIFGNGHGLRSPYFDNRFYWLSGHLYTWIGGLGAQLQSFQWFHPKPQERRVLAGHEFRPFISERKWLRVRVSWALVRQPTSLDASHDLIRGIEMKLGRI